MRVFKIEPAGDTRVNTWYVPAKKSWQDGLSAIEESLESQFLDPEKEWNDIKCTITCMDITEERWHEIIADS